MQGMPEDRMPDGMTMPMMDGSGANMETMDCPMMSEMMRMYVAGLLAHAGEIT